MSYHSIFFIYNLKKGGLPLRQMSTLKHKGTRIVSSFTIFRQVGKIRHLSSRNSVRSCNCMRIVKGFLVIAVTFQHLKIKFCRIWKTRILFGHPVHLCYCRGPSKYSKVKRLPKYWFTYFPLHCILVSFRPVCNKIHTAFKYLDSAIMLLNLAFEIELNSIQ